MKYDSVSLFDLANDNDIYVTISKKMGDVLSDKRKRYFKNMNDLSKKLDEKENTLYSFFWQKLSISLRMFMKLVKLFNIQDYEKEILWIGGRTSNKGIKTPKFPFNFNSYEGGKFIAAVLGDGCFHLNFEIGYRNDSQILLREIVKTANSVFGDVELVSKTNSRIIFPVILGKIVSKLGMLQGRKTITDATIPDFVFSSSKECRIGFMKQISDDEASSQINSPNSYSIRYEFAVEIPFDKFNEREKFVPRLLLGVYRLVKDLGYSTTRIYGGRVYKGRKKKRYGVSWAFDIQGKESLEKFTKEINFRVLSRKRKLENGVKLMKINTYGKSAKFVVLSSFNKLFNENAHVTKHELSEEINRTLRNSGEWLRKLRDCGLIQCIGGNDFIGEGFCKLNGRTPIRYILTDFGAEQLKNYIKIKEKNIIKIKACPKYTNSEPYSPWEKEQCLSDKI